jgi:hypothetical protein
VRKSLLIFPVAACIVASASACASHPVASSSAAASRTTVPAPGPSVKTNGSPVLGKSYPYRLFAHCGVPLVEFGKRAWQPVLPVPHYPGSRTGVENGYVAGTMTLVSAVTLRFTADIRTVTAPYVVNFRPATKQQAGDQQVCA